jgi:hypothetical protein
LVENLGAPRWDAPGDDTCDNDASRCEACLNPCCSLFECPHPVVMHGDDDLFAIGNRRRSATSQDRAGGKEVLHDVTEIAAPGFGRVDVEGDHRHASSARFGDNPCQGGGVKNIQPDAVDAIFDGRSNNADYVFNVEAWGADEICVHV